MIRSIVAVDQKGGIADDSGIPWLGKIPSDAAYYRDKIRSADVIMGYGMYKEMKHPYPDTVNYVATTRDEKLRKGFVAVKDAYSFIKNFRGDLWIMGGAGLYKSTFDLNDELYITQLDKDFNCTKFFPEYKNEFLITSESKPIIENDVKFNFQVWTRKYNNTTS